MSDAALAPDPFAASAGPGAYVPRRATERAFERLVRAVLEEGRPALLEGPAGLGKTVLLRRLCEEAGERFTPLYLPYPAFSPDELGHWVLSALGADAVDEPHRVLKAWIGHLREQGGSLLLVIDDATALPTGTARWLAELIRGSEGGLRLAMAALPSPEGSGTVAVLGRELELIPLTDPMSLEETRAYLTARLAMAKAPRERRALFDDALVERLHQMAGGVPRRVHAGADMVLLGGDPESLEGRVPAAPAPDQRVRRGSLSRLLRPSAAAHHRALADAEVARTLPPPAPPAREPLHAPMPVPQAPPPAAPAAPTEATEEPTAPAESQPEAAAEPAVPAEPEPATEAAAAPEPEVAAQDCTPRCPEDAAAPEPATGEAQPSVARETEPQDEGPVEVEGEAKPGPEAAALREAEDTRPSVADAAREIEEAAQPEAAASPETEPPAPEVADAQEATPADASPAPVDAEPAVAARSEVVPEVEEALIAAAIQSPDQVLQNLDRGAAERRRDAQQRAAEHEARRRQVHESGEDLPWPAMLSGGASPAWLPEARGTLKQAFASAFSAAARRYEGLTAALSAVLAMLVRQRRRVARGFHEAADAVRANLGRPLGPAIAVATRPIPVPAGLDRAARGLGRALAWLGLALLAPWRFAFSKLRSAGSALRALLARVLRRKVRPALAKHKKIEADPEVKRLALERTAAAFLGLALVGLAITLLGGSLFNGLVESALAARSGMADAAEAASLKLEEFAERRDDTLAVVSEKVRAGLEATSETLRSVPDYVSARQGSYWPGLFPKDERPGYSAAPRPAPRLATPAPRTAARTPAASRAPSPPRAAPARPRPIPAPAAPARTEPTPRPAPAEPEVYRVGINATPWAAIEVDGYPIGETPIAGFELEPGFHTFRAHMPDGTILEQLVEVGPNTEGVVFP